MHIFSRANKTLADHPVTAEVQSVATFTGSAFQFDGTPLLTFSATSISLEPRVAWVFTGALDVPIAGWMQGAVADVAKGRVAIFGEAAMFSERMCDEATPMGMNHPLAQDNARLLRSLLSWLGRRPP